MQQTAPDPAELVDLVSKLHYRPGWTFELKDIERDPGCSGLTFIGLSHGYNSRHPERGETYDVYFFFPVPPATFDRRSWQRWLFDRLLEVEWHETMEFFEIDGDHPYAPSHAPG